jgi:hypothetical protein
MDASEADVTTFTGGECVTSRSQSGRRGSFPCPPTGFVAGVGVRDREAADAAAGEQRHHGACVRGRLRLGAADRHLQVLSCGGLFANDRWSS